MKLPTIFIAAAVGVFFVVLIGQLAIRNQRELVADLPPRTECATLEAAYQAAEDYAAIHSGLVCPVLGTGSMAPYIPAAPNRAPIVVAYVVTDPAATFDSVRKGQLVIYKPNWNPGTVMHVAAVKDSGGWIMSGIANAHSEPDWRVTSSNFVAVAAATFVVSP